jgi:threonine aldolase
MNILTKEAREAAWNAYVDSDFHGSDAFDDAFNAAIAKLIEQGNAKRFAIQSNKEGEMLKMKFVYQIEEQPND